MMSMHAYSALILHSSNLPQSAPSAMVYYSFRNMLKGKAGKAAKAKAPLEIVKYNFTTQGTHEANHFLRLRKIHEWRSYLAS